MYGMPPPLDPDPKSGCNVVADVSELRSATELGSTGALMMLVFQALVDGNGTKPFSAPPFRMPLEFGPSDGAPSDMALHAAMEPYCGSCCADTQAAKKKEDKTGYQGERLQLETSTNGNRLRLQFY